MLFLTIVTTIVYAVTMYALLANWFLPDKITLGTKEWKYNVITYSFFLAPICLMILLMLSLFAALISPPVYTTLWFLLCNPTIIVIIRLAGFVYHDRFDAHAYYVKTIDSILKEEQNGSSSN